MFKKYNPFRTSAVVTLVAALNLGSVSTAQGDIGCNCSWIHKDGSSTQASSCATSASPADCFWWCVVAVQHVSDAVSLASQFLDCGSETCSNPADDSGTAVCVESKSMARPSHRAIDAVTPKKAHAD
jgi:hypothetical protein